METRLMNRDTVKPESVTIDDKQRHRIRAVVTPYNVFDSYNTRWIHGVWTRSLAEWPPPMAWSHDWREPIGRLIDYDDNPKHLETLHELDDFDAVPRAKQAFSQLQSGTLVNFSFGFDIHEKEPAKDREGGFDMQRGDLDEVSPVLRGSVPGTHPVAFRSAYSQFMDVAHRLDRGELSFDEAVSLVSDGVRATHAHARQDGKGIERHSHGNDAGMHAHAASDPMNRSGVALLPVMQGGVLTGQPILRAYQPEQTRADAKFAMPNGSYPISTCADVGDAAQLASHSKTYTESEIKAHVMKAKNALNCPDSVIPDSWNSGGRADATAQCPDCGAMNAADAKYCSQCGAEMPETARARQREADVSKLLQRVGRR